MQPRDEFRPSAVPASPGVYVYRDRFRKVIYVGKAVNLRRRMSSYFQPSRRNTADAKLRSLIHSIAYWECYSVRSENEALLLESRLIKEYAPHYNILMRDDKRYLMLKLDLSAQFPTLTPARVKKDDSCRYFGPFPHGSALRATMEFLLKHFQLRACRYDVPDEECRKRCLKRIVKDCCAPCSGNITREEYMEKVNQMLQILSGNWRPLADELQEKMTAAAAAAKFEEAAKYRDILNNLKAVFNTPGHPDRNFSRAYIPSPSGPEAVYSLQKALKLPTPPRVMECFDISNILGTLAVASMVSFVDGKPARDRYRRFRIKTVHQSDDFAMMQEAITRRYSRLLQEKLPFPDLLVVDGGKGQLSSAIEALVAMQCPPFPVIGLAKREEEIFLPGRSEPVLLDRHDPALRALQAMRDEAHRFAISYHRELRAKRLQQSLLDEIPGIGQKRKLQLLQHFGSLRQIRKASFEELAKVVGPVLAGKLQEFLHRQSINGEEKINAME